MQKKTVLLLDDEPQFCTRTCKTLKDAGLEVIESKNYREASKILQTGRVGLIIHGVHKTKTHWELCDRLVQEFPDIPTLHLDTGISCLEHGHEGGRLHGCIRHLAPEREFKNKIRTLWRMGRLVQQNRKFRNIFQSQVNLDRVLDCQDPETLIGNFMSFIGPQMDAKNILWLLDGDIEFYTNQLWKVKNMVQSTQQPHRSVSWKETSPKIISEIVDDLNSVLPPAWPGSLRPMTGEKKSTHFSNFIVLPIFKNRKHYGHLVLIDPAKRIKSAVVFYWLDRLTQAYRRALNFSESKGLCYIDDVTELYNQRYLGLALDTEISRSQRSKSPFSVLFIDIDHFKKVNDTRGHLVGSKILRQLSRILKKNIRFVDYGFRYGGDEYILLLVNTDSEAARFVGERIRKEVQGTEFNIDGTRLQLTLSIGIATYPDHATSKEEIINIADKAMYDGKNKSRNIVFVAS